jgi:hypothetical protein
MSDNDQDRKLDLEPGEEEFDELEGAPEEEEEFEAESHEAEQEHHRFGRGHHDEGAGRGRRGSGSVRESHERVHIDDRLSAVYALLVAVVLVGALAVALAGNWVPEPSVPTLAPLVVPTAQVAPSASPTVAPSAP